MIGLHGMSVERTQKAVDESLDNAFENGNFDEDGDLYGKPSMYVAIDLCEKDADFEDSRPVDVEPYVRDWMSRHGL